MLIYKKQIAEDILLGIWSMDRSTEDLCREYPHWKSIIANVHHPKRRLEVISAHVLLADLIGKSDFKIEHNRDGKPLLDGYHLSISHTANYVAVIISTHSEVAIDIERHSQRACQARSWFLRADEPYTTIPECLLAWSAKETVYKFYSSAHLPMKDIRIVGDVQEGQGRIIGEIPSLGQSVAINYEFWEEFVLTYAVQ